MNRVQRAAYLSAMGIAQWQLREGDLDSPDNLVSASPSHSPRVAVADVVADAVVVAAAADPAVDGAAERAEKGSPLPRFELMCTVVGDFLVVDDIAGMQFAGSAYQQWIQAVLFSAVREPLTISLQQRWAWPLVDAGLADDSEQAARQMLAAWLARELEKQSVSCALLMGEGAVALCAESKVAPGQRILLQQPDQMAAVATHASRTLWVNPSLKRELSQHLQMLRP